MSRRHKLAALTTAERVVLLQSLVMLPVTALSVKSFGFQKWQTALAKLPGGRKHSSLPNSLTHEAFGSSLEVNDHGARQVARLVRAAANHGLYHANCLEQSLVLWFLLKRRGLESEIRFGARKEESQLQAHAWVECLGIALNEDRGVEQRYSPFGVRPSHKPV